MTMTITRLRALTKDIQFRDWSFRCEEAGPSPVYGFFLRVLLLAPDASVSDTAREELTWKGRRWHISQYAIDEEVVQTALKAVLTALEHEAREDFKYCGRAIYGPHQSLGQLLIASETETRRR